LFIPPSDEKTIETTVECN